MVSSGAKLDELREDNSGAAIAAEGLEELEAEKY